MTDCLRIPTSVQDADAVIVACSGHVAWRPLFIIGVQAALLVVLVLVAAAIAWRALR